METAENFIIDDNRWQWVRHGWYWSLPDTHLFTLCSSFPQRYCKGSGSYYLLFINWLSP